MSHAALIANSFHHLAYEGAPKAKAILVKVDQIAEALGFDDELLDGVLVGLTS